MMTNTTPSTSTTTTAAAAAAPLYYPHYIFGYGSLICPKSRAITAPATASRNVVPVRVHHLQRQWVCPGNDMTFMGVAVCQGSVCTGVLVPVTNNELADLDIRELGYERVLIPHAHIECININKNEDDDDSDDAAEKEAKQSIPLDTISYAESQIWVYIPEQRVPVTASTPIAQTYLDVILRGCLSISPSFAKDMILTTRGWHAKDFGDATICSGDQKEIIITTTAATPTATEDTVIDNIEHHIHWVNDRHDPLYERADLHFSRNVGPSLVDQLLHEIRPEMKFRRPHMGGKSLTM